jgi:hypothetical protein
MKIKILVSLLLMISSVILSCSQKKVNPTPSVPVYPVMAKVDGASFNGIAASTMLFNDLIGFDAVDASGNNLTLYMPNNAVAGTYSLGAFTDSTYYAVYFNAGNGVSYDTKGTNLGTLTITGITINPTDGNLTKLRATFSFTGYDSSSPNQVVVTEGVVNYN